MKLSNSILTTTTTEIPKEQAMVSSLQQLPQHVICVGLGLVSGAAGVVLAVGLVVVVQLLLSPTVIFSPRVIQLTVAAILVGLGISWLLGRVAYHLSPSLSYNVGKQGKQVILICSALTALLESLLFFTYGS